MFKKLISILSVLLISSGIAFAAIQTGGAGHNNVFKDGVYAYVSTPAATTTTVAGTYYRLQGTFTNEILENWVLAGSPLAITYDGSGTVSFEIEVHANMTSDTNGTTASLALYKNGALQINSVMDTYMKTAGESYTVSLNDVLALSNGDYIEIYMKSDQAGAQITANTMTTSAQTFY